MQAITRASLPHVATWQPFLAVARMLTNLLGCTIPSKWDSLDHCCFPAESHSGQPQYFVFELASQLCKSSCPKVGSKAPKKQVLFCGILAGKVI